MTHRTSLTALSLLCCFYTTTAFASAEHVDQLAPVVSKAVGFLKSSQAEDGSFSNQGGTGITSLVATGLMQNGLTPEDPMVAKALEYLLAHVRPDGGIYAEGSRHRNYETCIAMMCFNEANQDKKYDKLLANAEKFLKQLQWDVSEGHDESSTSYGGAGYGRHERPDLSNTSFFIEALESIGADDNDPAIQRALVFVSRCQNLATVHNQTEYADKNPDGGFYYTIAAGGSSQAGETPDGGLRSYGSMTYAGLKSMIYAGVGPDDPRVKAATTWIQKHYTLSENPGMGMMGYYYYLQTFAKALAAIGDETLKDADGTEHNWRQELIAELAKQQLEDGSWLNKTERWLESDPNLVTGYVLMTLANCRESK